MHITHLRLTNYCGFAKFSLNFSSFSVFVGSNNGGKTTILRAIKVIFDALEMSIDAYTSQVRQWEDKADALEKTLKERSVELKIRQDQRREEQFKKWGDMLPQEKARREAELNSNDKQERQHQQNENRNQTANLQLQRPKWQCDLGQLVRRQYAESAQRFHFRHKLDLPASLEMDVHLDKGDITLKLIISDSQNVTLSCLLNAEDFWALSSTDRLSVVTTLQQFRCFFVQPIGNLAPSEHSLAWPQVQQLMAQGKEHDVWRNQLHWLAEGKSPEAYQRVIARVQNSLGSIRVRPPSRTRESQPKVEVTYEENGIGFDLAEGGAGLRTFLGVAACIELADASVLLFDEPDAHLHSAVQRQLAEFLESQASEDRQIILATHSPDMIDEFSLDSLSWIDRSQTESQPCSDLGKMMVDLGAISHKEALEFSKADAVLYFEAKPDRKVFEQLLQRCGYGKFLALTQIAQLGGCGDIEHLPAVARFMEDRHKRRVAIAVIRDADYGREDAKNKTEGQVLVLSLPCKELENLLLLQPKAVLDAVLHSAEKRREYTSIPYATPSLADIENYIDEVTQSDEVRDMVENNWIISRLPSLDAGLLQKVRVDFLQSWKDPLFRRRYCPGKFVFRKVRKWVQDQWQLSFPLPFEFYKPDSDVESLFEKIQEHFNTALK